MSGMGLGHFPPRTFPPDFSPEKNVDNFFKIEIGMMKQYSSSRSWIDETILFLDNSKPE